MKYVMLTVTHCGMKRKMPVIFPNSVNHDDVAVFFSEALRASYGDIPVQIDATSAGFIDLRVENTHGKSTTLGLPSDEADARTINVHDYFHGIEF